MKNPLEITIVVSVPQSGGNFQRNNSIFRIGSGLNASNKWLRRLFDWLGDYLWLLEPSRILKAR